MAKTQFEKTMRNISISEDSRKPQRPVFNYRTWQFVVELDLSEVPRLKRLMQLELEYYNHLVNNMGSRLRTRPEIFLDSSDTLKKLFALTAFTGFDTYRLSILKDGDLPKEWEPYRNFVFGKDESGKRKYTDNIAVLLQVAAVNCPIHPEVRRRIALEVFTFYQTQARVSLQAIPTHLRGEQLFKTPPANLETLDIIRKRHLQIPKDLIKVTWDHETETSLFQTPYLRSPIKIPTIDFTQIQSWNYCILHQAPGSIPLGKTPWVLDVRHIQGHYLLKYLDVKSPHAGAAFHIARRGMNIYRGT